MYYMYNKWCFDECLALFGRNLGVHIWRKYESNLNEGGDKLYWYAGLDKTCQDKLVSRANEIYKK
jgi:hypothetical protein